MCFINCLRVFISICLIIGISGLRCPLYWQLQNGDSCYRFRFRNLLSWGAAEAWCQSQNAHLVKLETATERDWVAGNLLKVQQNSIRNNTSITSFWTGLNNNGTSGGNFVWADGSAVDPTVVKGQSIVISAQRGRCVKFVNNKLTNVKCAESNGYICERHIGIPLTCEADRKWQSFNNFCYRVYGQNGATWDGAQQQCDQQGGNLFTVESSSEETVIHDFSVNLQKDFWIGVKSYPQGNSYTWLLAKGNETLTQRLAYWSPIPVLQSSQYNNTCVYVKYSTDSSAVAWTTDTCATKRNFVCKKPEGTCQPGWLAHQNRCYQFNTQYTLSWQQSDQYCKTQGGRLVESYGKTATTFINSYLSQFQDARIASFWIGATDNSTNNYTWSYGQQIKYQNWAVNPPDNTANRQDCVYIDTNDVKGLWRTTSNCGVTKPFICIIGFDQPVQAVTTPTPTLICDDHWTLNSGRCFQFNDTKKNWLDARESCQSQGGDLATVDTDAVNSFVIGLINRNDNEYWIGLNDRTQNRKYIWIQSGAQLSSFNKWCKNEPNDYTGTESCVQYFTTNLCWNDRGCSAQLKYICQKSPRNIPLGPPVTTAAAQISAKCGLGWQERPQSQYCYSFQGDLLSWQDARQVCQKMGGDLASVHDRAEQVYIQTQLSSSFSMWMWLGGTDRSKEGGWSWSDGTPFQFLNWAGGEPNGDRRENCIQIYTTLRDQQWNDGPCNGRQGFICKKSYGTITTIPPRATPQVPAGQFLGCPSFWKKHGTSCWLFVQKMVPADVARKTCQQYGGYLATVNSQDEQNFMNANIPKPMKGTTGIFNGGAVWIGLSDRITENYFVWDEGRPVTYTNWGPGEPNNWQNKDEDCVAVWLLDGSWFDITCNTPLPGYVCRKSAQVVASTGVDPLLKGCTKPYRGIGYGASCYALRDTISGATPVSWQLAQSACQTTFGGQLATVNDRYVQSFLASYIDTRKDNFWIGLSDQVTPGTYAWIQGQADKFTFWNSNHTGNERNTCVVMRTMHPIGLWDNKQCTESHNYICETPRTGFTPAPTTAPKILPCPSGWKSFATFCYKLYNQRMTWLQGRDYCNGFGGDLVSIQSQPEADFIKSNYISRNTAWLGINDWDVENKWVWSDKSAVTFTAWNRGEPNNYNNEDCAMVVQNGKWVDINCFSNQPVICKRLMGTPFVTTVTPPIGITSIACGVENMWLFYNGSCYMTSPVGRNSQLSWYDARKYCNSFSSDLASIHTNDENRFVYSIAKKNREEYWIGLNELENPGKLKWINNDAVDFINWDQNEPNDQYGAERCTAMKAINGNWMDDNCNMKMGFICKKRVGEGPPTTTSPPALPGGCRDSFVPSPFSNKCFYLSNSTALMTWNQSLKFCQTHFQRPYDMASISDEMEQAFLTSLVQGLKSNVWIGLNDLRFSRQFVWQDNSQFKYNNWAEREPNGRNRIVKGIGFVNQEKCVEMYTQGYLAGSWNDQNCDLQRYTICEGKKVPGLPDTGTPKGSCSKPEYTFRGTSCYKFIGSPAANWQDAETKCQADGAVLVTINDLYENAFVEANMGPNVDYWIGFKYNRDTTSFAWQRNWPVKFTNWAFGEPSNGPLDLCVKSMNGQWDSTGCTRSMGYVCEINSAPLPPVTSAPNGHCKNPDETIYNNFCYYFSPLTYMDWPSAGYTCTKRGMDLVSITSAIELDYVFTTSLNARSRNGKHIAQNIWIGLNKGLQSSFQWTDNTPYSYNNWNVGEPSDPINSTTEECVEMYRDSAKWNDVNCFKKNAFVCKGRAVLPSTLNPPSTITPGVTFPTFPNIFPVTTFGPNGQPVGTTKRPTSKPLSGITFAQPTGHMTGPNGYLQDRFVNKKHGLTGGRLAAVIIVIVLVLGIGALFGFLYWRKRNPSASTSGNGASGGGSGFDNALFNKENEEVNIDSTA
ncbi:macrophage mannose receptor 1-like [Mytilus trossulus]|uniref:macrophage mannose receptor 1-like n=1 Tax=Mytilus trossulus TaxID=6551 RepID=UPI0030068033